MYSAFTLFFSGQRMCGWVIGRGVSHTYECKSKEEDWENRNKKHREIWLKKYGTILHDIMLRLTEDKLKKIDWLLFSNI